MYVGHYAVALGAKRVAPGLSLGTLVLAAQWLDLMWPLFLLLGIEHVRIVPGITAATPLDFYDYPISHSLLTVLGWSVGFALVYFARRRNVRDAIVLGIAVLSHWLLDAVVHRPDLPLFPGSRRMAGLGLWNAPEVEIYLESALFAAGLWVYLRSTRAKDRTGKYAFWGLIGFLVITFAANITGPPPPNVKVLAWVAMAQWLIVVWAYWVERHRVVVNR